MFRSGEAVPDPGTELPAALAARRTSIVVLTSVLAVASVGILALRYEQFTATQVALTALVFPAAALTIRNRRTDLAIRWAMLAIVLQAGSTVFSEEQSDARLSASVLLFLAASFGAVSLRRRARSMWLAYVTALWILIVPAIPLEVSIGIYNFNARWATLPQLLASALWAAHMWDAEIRRVRLRDELAARRMQESVQALALRERLRLWRESVVRIHETVLNDIRSALDMEQVDWQRLGSQLAGQRAIAPPSPPATDLHSIVASIIDTEDVGASVVAGALPQLRFSVEGAAALRGLLLEVSRNLARHSAATKIAILGERVDEHVELHLLHDGHDETRVGEAGIGLGVVMADALAVLNASIAAETGLTELRIAVPPQDSDTSLLVSWNMWRTVLASGASGLVAGGIFDYALAALTHGATGIAIGFAATFVAGTAVYATVRHRELPGWALVLAAAAATAVPMMAASLPLHCGPADLPVIVSTLSAIGLGAVLLWAPSPRWWWLALCSMAAVTRLAMILNLNCRPSGVASFVAALSAPVLLSVVAMSFRSSAQRENQARNLERDARVAAVTAEAAQAVGDELHAAVQSATDLLSDCAARRMISDDERTRLRCWDALIRSSIQVSPDAAGAFSLASRALVHDASAASIPVRVLTLRDSGDVRPLPSALVNVLGALIAASRDGQATLRVLTSPGEDRLILTTSRAAALSSGLPSGWRLDFEDGSADLDAVDADAPAMLMVQRRVPERSVSTAQQR